MPDCHEMRSGDVYICEDCGLELQVVKECKEAGAPPDECKCAPCSFICCGEELKKKKQGTQVSELEKLCSVLILDNRTHLQPTSFREGLSLMESLAADRLFCTGDVAFVRP